MDRPHFRAFTLVELLVAILIICLLLALLMPVIASAWQMAEMTQCKTNLATLYKAQVVWAADQAKPAASLGQGWAGSMETYLENRPSALKCPSCPRVSRGYTPGGAGIGVNDTPDKIMGGQSYTPMELKDVCVGVLNMDGSVKYRIPLQPSARWACYGQAWQTDGRLLIKANIDEGGGILPDGQFPTDDDFIFTIEFYNGKPWKVTFGDCDANGTSQNTLLDFETQLNDVWKGIWNGQKFGIKFAEGHEGETINLYKEATSTGGDGNQLFFWNAWYAAQGILGATNYGLSRGACFDKAGRAVPVPDPKLFFILDYPRTLADYTTIGNPVPDTAYFDKIFISPAPPTPTTAWAPPPGLTGWTWQETQALRHFGKANVLFCDGHVESLGKDDLESNNPLWWYGAQ